MFFNDHCIIYIIFYFYRCKHILSYYMGSPRASHIILTKDTCLLLGYYIILLLLLFLHQSYKHTHFFQPGWKIALLGAINLLANNIKEDLNEVTLYEMKLKSMKRKIIYYKLNERSQVHDFEKN